jgi:hypothetical protein
MAVVLENSELSLHIEMERGRKARQLAGGFFEFALRLAAKCNCSTLTLQTGLSRPHVSGTDRCAMGILSDIEIFRQQP